MGGCCGAMKTGQKSLPENKQEKNGAEDKQNEKCPGVNDVTEAVSDNGGPEVIKQNNTPEIFQNVARAQCVENGLKEKEVKIQTPTVSVSETNHVSEGSDIVEDEIATKIVTLAMEAALAETSSEEQQSGVGGVSDEEALNEWMKVDTRNALVIDEPEAEVKHSSEPVTATVNAPLKAPVGTTPAVNPESIDVRIETEKSCVVLEESSLTAQTQQVEESSPVANLSTQDDSTAEEIIAANVVTGESGEHQPHDDQPAVDVTSPVCDISDSKDIPFSVNEESFPNPPSLEEEFSATEASLETESNISTVQQSSAVSPVWEVQQSNCEEEAAPEGEEFPLESNNAESVEPIPADTAVAALPTEAHNEEIPQSELDSFVATVESSDSVTEESAPLSAETQPHVAPDELSSDVTQEEQPTDILLDLGSEPIPSAIIESEENTAFDDPINSPETSLEEAATVFPVPAPPGDDYAEEFDDMSLPPPPPQDLSGDQLDSPPEFPDVPDVPALEQEPLQEHTQGLISSEILAEVISQSLGQEEVDRIQTPLEVNGSQVQALTEANVIPVLEETVEQSRAQRDLWWKENGDNQAEILHLNDSATFELNEHNHEEQAYGHPQISLDKHPDTALNGVQQIEKSRTVDLTNGSQEVPSLSVTKTSKVNHVPSSTVESEFNDVAKDSSIEAAPAAQA